MSYMAAPRRVVRRRAARCGAAALSQVGSFFCPTRGPHTRAARASAHARTHAHEHRSADAQRSGRRRGAGMLQRRAVRASRMSQDATAAGGWALGGWRALCLACRRAMTLCGHALSRAWRRPGELPRSGYRGSKQPMGPPTSARRCATQARGAVRASPAAGTPRRRTRLMRAGSQRRDSDPAQWATPARTAT